MSTLKRFALFILLAIAGFALVPQVASALSFSPSAGGPITIAPPNDQVKEAATADLDGNGKDDIVSVGNSKGIYVFLANDQGTGFTQAPGSPFGTGDTGTNGRLSVFVGRFGGDADLDLLIQNENYPRTLSTFIGNGDGTFGTTADFTYEAPAPGPNYPLSVSYGTAGDVNGDGWDDIVIGMTRRMFMVALGSATGELTTAPGSPFLVPETLVNPSGSFTSTAIGDFNGDGDPDVAVGLDDNNNSLPAVYTAEGDGTGAFTSTGVPAKQFGAFQWPTSLSAIDLNGDDYEDLAIVSPNAAAVSTLIGSANGLVTNAAPNGSVSLAGNYPYAITTSDLDNDGFQDIAVANRGGALSVSALLSAGDGNLTQPSNSPFLLPPINGKNFAANTIKTGDFTATAPQTSPPPAPMGATPTRPAASTC